MTNDQKTDIAGLANNYIAQKGMTAAQFSKLARVNESYLSAILNGVFTVSASGNKVEIADKWFVSIAEIVGYSFQKNYWPHINTREFMDAVSILEDSRARQAMRTIIIDTGAGKTYTADKYKQKHPLHTYVLKMHSLMKINDLFNELIYQLNIAERGGKSYKRAQILIKLRQLRRDGANPIVIIDEGENMNQQMMQMLKGFYDGLIGYVGITLIGTPKLLELLQDAKAKDKQGGPQFYRRVKAGLRVVRVMQKKENRFAPFFEKLQIEKPLCKLLCELCDNYGELHDYLEPAMREADRMNVGLTEQFFREIYDMPEYAKVA